MYSLCVKLYTNYTLNLTLQRERRKTKEPSFWNINVHELIPLKAINLGFGTRKAWNVQKLMGQLMRQFMGINGETFLFWNTKRAKCAEIERFISVYRLEENGSLLKEGTGDAVGWALRACSYKTKTKASQQRRSRHTLQGVFLVLSLPLFLFITLSLPLFASTSRSLLVSSSLCLFVSLSLWLFVS